VCGRSSAPETSSVSTPEAPPEQFTQDRLSFERLLADLSARFVNLPPAKVDQEIEQSLQKIVGAMGVDRSSLLEVSEDGKELITTHQWARDGLPRDPPRDVNEATSWYTRTLLRGETVAYSRMPEELPDEAGPEKAYCARTGLRSNLTIPLSGRSTHGRAGYRLLST
jgi:hypothetical protein